MRIPIARPELGDSELQAVRDVIESGWVTQGPKVAAFEKAVADYCGARDAVAVSSCTTALHLSLIAAGLQRDDEVIVPSMSFIATANAVVHAGGIPVFAEVDPRTFNLDPDDVEARISPRTKAIVLVHQLGLPADRDRFAVLAYARGLTLVEDAACAIGSRYREHPIGAVGRFVCFSFHPRKLITTGDGGMILTDDPEIAAQLRRLRQHGMNVSDVDRHDSDHVIRESYIDIGYNYRMTDIQAAIGICQVSRLPSLIARRKEQAAFYDSRLAIHPRISTPVVPSFADWNVQTYSVRLTGFASQDRDRVMARLLEQGIATRPGVMTAHREPAYSSSRVSLPISERASDASLALPVHNQLSEHDQEEIVAALLDAVEDG